MYKSSVQPNIRNRPPETPNPSESASDAEEEQLYPRSPICTGTMEEVKKHGMTVQVGLGTESESPEEVTRYPLYGPYKVWIKAFGVWAPTGVIR